MVIIKHISNLNKHIITILDNNLILILVKTKTTANVHLYFHSSNNKASDHRWLRDKVEIKKTSLKLIKTIKLKKDKHLWPILMTFLSISFIRQTAIKFETLMMLTHPLKKSKGEMVPSMQRMKMSLKILVLKIKFSIQNGKLD